MLFILSQISVGIGMLSDFIGKTMKKKFFIILFMALANFFFATSYVLMKKTVPAITNGIFLVRGIWYVILEQKDAPPKKYTLPIILLLSAFTVQFIIFWSGPIDLFVLGSMLVSTIGLAFRNTLLIRCVLIASSTFWSFYNFYAGGIVNFINDIVTTVTLIAAIIIYNVILPRKEKKIKEMKEAS